ncbi:MAG: type II toxin-antitoxin system toxin DNA ADP-ribosyl transferase DarT [Roseateles sp.]|uniref:type II toxin-antitoxin system toxin DNA ADP-ribosyl transferase DarT n=1 Tax=Roseateles sp. TaxID=1971397 RepID=UPI00403520C7
MPNHYAELNPEKALIFRIIHRNNLPWVLDNGLHCGNDAVRAPNWVSIGNPELISKRATHPVQPPPGGRLNDYVPFYFTPFSPMLLNIKSGRGGIPQRSNDEIVILVSSLRRVAADANLRWLFTDSHAYYQWANYYTDLQHLDKIDWPILQARDFKRDPDDPAKFERYQAEALVHQHMPVSALLGLVCYTPALKQNIEQQVAARGLKLAVHARPGWYF